MISEIIFYAIDYLSHLVLLLTGLFVMLKIQKFNYNWPGLIGSALLASGLDMIPYFGHALAVPVLYICIWKMTRESIFPDAAFTVLFSYLFMFGVNMFLLTFLTPSLRPDLSRDTNNAEDNVPTNVVVAAPTNSPVPVVAAKPVTVQAADNTVMKNLSVKGLIRNGSNSMLVLGGGTKTRTLSLGEKTVIRTPAGSNSVEFVGLDTNSVTLSVDGTPVKMQVP